MAPFRLIVAHHKGDDIYNLRKKDLPSSAAESFQHQPTPETSEKNRNLAILFASILMSVIIVALCRAIYYRKKCSAVDSDDETNSDTFVNQLDFEGHGHETDSSTGWYTSDETSVEGGTRSRGDNLTYPRSAVLRNKDRNGWKSPPPPYTLPPPYNSLGSSPYSGLERRTEDAENLTPA
ncbi:hypothetical protein VP1G_07201 [Cytospora mali]|uniref:Uncharacterized protein n=1 Tax=Cytospora mali TaxID=578113 RepID=A0A194V7V7_CYTMA|nr:hypothetical protein VP1G_07201 [Valsa mali var. pyri (nom. inval.)]